MSHRLASRLGLLATIAASLAAGTAGASAQVAAHERVIVEVPLRELAAVPEGAELVTFRADGSRALSPLPSRPTAVTLTLPPSAEGWTLTCQGPGVWCPRIDLGKLRSPRTAVLPLYSSVTLHGALSFPHGEIPPAHLVAQAWFHEEPAQSQLEFKLPIENRSFQLTVPRGNWIFDWR